MEQRDTVEMPRPAYLVMWDVAEEKAKGIREPESGDGDIYASLYREKILEQPDPLPTPQPARIDLRGLTCDTCGAPASPHRAPHAVRLIVPAR